jgi:hypothetical protein
MARFWPIRMDVIEDDDMDEDFANMYIPEDHQLCTVRPQAGSFPPHVCVYELPNSKPLIFGDASGD